MGRQINVKLDALDALCHLDYYEETYESEYRTWDGQDAHSEEVLGFVTVCTPQWQSITLSVYGCYGTVDCRGPGSPAFWFEEWLIANKVPFLEG
jgi:hypothetical protein